MPITVRAQASQHLNRRTSLFVIDIDVAHRGVYAPVACDRCKQSDSHALVGQRGNACPATRVAGRTFNVGPSVDSVDRLANRIRIEVPAIARREQPRITLRPSCRVQRAKIPADLALQSRADVQRACARSLRLRG